MLTSLNSIRQELGYSWGDVGKEALAVGWGFAGVMAIALTSTALVGFHPEPASGLGHSATIAIAGER